MGEELRAAAERVRRWKDGESLSAIYPEAAAPDAAVSELPATDVALGWDWRELALAYLEEHPAPAVSDPAAPLTEQRLAELKRLADAATPGPWTTRQDGWSDGTGWEVVTWADSRAKREYRESHPGWDAFKGTTVLRAVQSINGSGRAAGPHLLIDNDEVRDNAAFAAACDPDTIKSLLADLARGRDRLARLERALVELVEYVRGNPPFRPLRAMLDDAEVALAETNKEPT